MSLIEKLRKFKCVLMTLAVVLCICQVATSQSMPPKTNQSPEGFFGVGFGINDYGMGISVEKKAYNKMWVYAKAGISTWGYRLSGGLTHYFNTNGYKSSFSLGYSYATGIKDFSPTLEVEEKFSFPTSYEEKEVLLDLHPVHTLNFIYSYSLKAGRKSKFVFSTGYALKLSGELYKQKSSYELTEKSEDFIRMMAPGGLILGVNFMF